MFTLYEFKHNRCFRTCSKTPFYIKNIILLTVQTLILLCTYLIYFRTDGGNYQNAIKILKGLNSNTFNYLETNSGPLDIGRDILPVDFYEWNAIKFFA